MFPVTRSVRLIVFLSLAMATMPATAADERPIAIPLVSEIKSPAGAASGESNLCAGPEGRVYFSWIERDTANGHRVSFSYHDTAGWSSPRTVVTSKSLFVNWADLPALAANQYGRMMAAWLEKTGKGTYAYGVRASLSSDGGASWGAPFWLHNDTTATEHGFVSLVAGPNGSFDAVWLDGRETAHDGPMTLRHARIDRDGKFVAAHVIDPRVCDCCPTSAAYATDGALLVVYRDRSEDEIRDIAIARFDGTGWSEPMRVHADNWQIAGCPVNGPAILTFGTNAVVAWYTGVDSAAPAVYAAFSTDDGHTFGGPVRLDQGNPLGRVDLAVGPDGAVYVTWLEQSGKSANLVLARLESGVVRQSLNVAVIPPGRESGIPHVAHDGRHLLLAWTDPTLGMVRTAAVEFESSARLSPGAPGE